MHKKEFCPHCGQGIMRQKQGLSHSLVLILAKVAECSAHEVHLQRDIELTKNEYANFQKLQYWGLARKGDRCGYWAITKAGHEFLSGRTTLPRFLWTFNNKVVFQEGGQINIWDLKIEPREYMKRAEYAEYSVPLQELQGQYTF